MSLKDQIPGYDRLTAEQMEALAQSLIAEAKQDREKLIQKKWDEFKELLKSGSVPQSVYKEMLETKIVFVDRELKLLDNVPVKSRKKTSSVRYKVNGKAYLNNGWSQHIFGHMSASEKAQCVITTAKEYCNLVGNWPTPYKDYERRARAKKAEWEAKARKTT